MKILVTGATGFIGRNLVSKLIKEKHDVAAREFSVSASSGSCYG